MNTKHLLRWLPLAALVALMTLVAVACGDDDDDAAQSTATPTTAASPSTVAEPTRQPSATSTPAASGDAAVVAPVIARVTANDTAGLKALVSYTKVKCAVTPAGGFPQAPKCPAGVADGTLVDAFPAASCEGYYVAPADIEAALAGAKGTVYGVFKRTTPGGSPEFPQGVYGIILSDPSGTPNTAHLIGLDANGKIVTFSAGCGTTPAQLAQNNASTATWVIPPKA